MNYSNFLDNTLCICNHTFVNHYADDSGCAVCTWDLSNKIFPSHCFTIDNLTYIELLAKPKNLV